MDAQEFREPFRHWLADGPTQLIADASEEIQPRTWPGWVRYDNENERRKRTVNDFAGCPRMTALFIELFALESKLSMLTGVANLQGDLYGAGIHVTDPDGYLQPHLDYALKPGTEPPLERRVNLILFMNREWREEWGGAFELCDDMGNPVKRIYPAYGRMVIWEASDTAFHGTELVRGPEPRITAATYYLAPARPGATRKRALYVPRR